VQPSVQEQLNLYKQWKWPELHIAIHMKDYAAAKEILFLKPKQAAMQVPSISLMGHYINISDNDNDHPDYDYFIAFEEGISAIELAAQHDQFELLESLIQLGANPLQMRREYINSIIIPWLTEYKKEEGASRGLQETVYDYKPQKFIHPGHGKERFKDTSLLFWAILNNNLEMCLLLIELGCDTRIVYERNQSVWRYVNNLGNYVVEKEKYSALELAQKLVHSEIVLYLQSIR
jgi:ankyrin repeat protein